MNLTFTHGHSFTLEWKRLRLTDEDLQALEAQIGKRPDAGALMEGTGGLRKIRFAPPSWHTGKSGATRVCYVWFVQFRHCFLATIFAKNEKQNLSAADKAEFRKVIAQIRSMIEKGH